MHGYKKGINEHAKTNYLEYVPYKDEPKVRRNYYLSAEFEDELLDDSYFLKRRVWRQMRKAQKQSLGLPAKHRYHKSVIERLAVSHHKPTHIV